MFEAVNAITGRYPTSYARIETAPGSSIETAVAAATRATAPGVVRTWTRVEDLMQEVAMARIYAGVHYRNSTGVGQAMGRSLGELALMKYPSDAASR